MIHKKNHKSQGQALLEFALIITVLLMIIFLIIEASRIMWAWVTVQNAARSGARFAITGLFDPGCATNGIPKYQYLCDDTDPLQIKDPNYRRPASIVKKTHEALSGLRLNETGTLTDEYGYEIFVWGVDDDEIDGVSNFWRGSYMDPPRGPEPYGGKPNLPVAVRIIYYVPIITPFFRPIRETIPVYGQTVLYNEPFDQLGGTGRSAGVPPPIPTLPTPGVTPTHTPTPTPGDTATPTETPTDTPVPTAEPCPVRYTSSLVDNSTFASVTGLWWDDANSQNHVVTFYDITAGGDPEIPNSGTLVVLGTAVMVTDTAGNQVCPGVGDTAPPNQLSSPLVGGHFIKVINTDGSSAVAQVQQGTDTPTPTNTATPLPTSTPAPANTPMPTATPLGPYVDVLQPCLAAGSSRQINVIGANGWPLHTISIYYDGVLIDRILGSEHTGSFSKVYTVAVTEATHTIEARSSTGFSDTDTFDSPCPNITPTATTTAVTSTPRPEDLVIMGQPALISTPPIVEYKPVQFQVVITNTGQVDVSGQFFVDIYFDPTEVFSTSIPLTYSDGYLAVGSLAGGTSKVITITSPIGFTGGESQRLVYGMVDSLETINEINEANNVSGGLNVDVTPAPVPSATPQGNPDDTISGLVRAFVGSWVPQRAFVWLQDESDPNILFGPFDAQDGLYTFLRVPNGTTYTVIACQFREDGLDYVGQRPAISPPNLTANVFMLIDEAGCPLP